MANNLIYKVLLFRTDGQVIDVLETRTLKDAETCYYGLSKEWVDSTAEKRPFKLPSPIMHAMLPSLILDIKVESITEEEYQRNSNPYYQEMQRDGVSGVMNRNFNTNGGV